MGERLASSQSTRLAAHPTTTFVVVCSWSESVLSAGVGTAANSRVCPPKPLQLRMHCSELRGSDPAGPDARVDENAGGGPSG